MTDKHRELNYWCATGNKEMVEMLLCAGADKDKANEYGSTPLIVASVRRVHGNR